MSENKKPSIRFKGFTEAWEQCKLGELVDVCSGRDYKHLSEGTIPVYGTGGYMLSVNDALSYDRDAIGIGRKGTIDRPYILKAPFWTVDTLFYAIPREKVDLNFAFDIFQNIDWKKKDESTGVPSLSKTAINDIDVLAPKYGEQQTIGQFFAAIDNLITLHQRKYDKLVNVKKSMLEKMFPRDGKNVPEIRFSGFTEAWEQRKLTEILIQRTEHQKISGDVPLLAFSYAEGVINPEDKKSNKRDFIMTDKYNKIFSRTELNDIIYNPANVIHGAIHRNKLGTGVVSPIYKIFMCNGVSPKFIGERLHTDKFIQEVTKYIEGTVVKLRTLSPEMFLEMSIEIPKSYEEQDKIGTYFTNLDNLITLHQREVEKLQNIKKSCLEKMFV